MLRIMLSLVPWRIQKCPNQKDWGWVDKYFVSADSNNSLSAGHVPPICDTRKAPTPVRAIKVSHIAESIRVPQTAKPLQ